MLCSSFYRRKYCIRTPFGTSVILLSLCALIIRYSNFHGFPLLCSNDGRFDIIAKDLTCNEFNYLQSLRHIFIIDPSGEVESGIQIGTRTPEHSEWVGRLHTYFIHEAPSKDFLKFSSKADTRAVSGVNVTYSFLLDGSAIEKPIDERKFAIKWEYGHFIECLGLKFKRKGKRIIPEDYIDSLSKFRDYLEIYTSNPMLWGGTLLGWYRECSFIWDTTDLDMTVKIDNFNKTLLEDIKKAKVAKLLHVLGRINDSLELSVMMENKKIDVFFLFRDNATDWIGAMIIKKRQKLQYHYPFVNRICTGDLLGKLFYIPCNVKDVLKVFPINEMCPLLFVFARLRQSQAEYGENYLTMHPNKNYVYYKTAKNVVFAGTWSKKEWKDVYKKYS